MAVSRQERCIFAGEERHHLGLSEVIQTCIMPTPQVATSPEPSVVPRFRFP